MTGNIAAALLLTAAAGLSTTIGSIIGLAVRKPGPAFMGFTLGFSAGIMILISFVELLQGSIASIGFVHAQLWFFAGMIAYFFIDLIVPHDYLGDHDHRHDESSERLIRTSLLVAFGIAIHNFPEGMATFVGALEDPKLGVAIAIAIAIHNIPEGLAVSAPIYAATGKRGKAFLWSFLSGVTEPLGAAVAAVFLMPILTPAVLGGVLAAVAGIMVAISIDELVPAAKSFNQQHVPIVGVIVGMAVMAFSLWMLRV